MKKLFSTLIFAFAALIAVAQTARVQVIHNSPTPGTSAGPVVDIYVNDGLLPELTAVPFRAATPFLDVPALVDIQVDVRVSPSTLADPVVGSFPLGQLAENGTYVVIANGIVGDLDNPFSLAINGNAKEAADNAGEVEFAAFHGSPDAPNVDIDARAVGNLVSDLAYAEYTPYLAVAPALYYIDVRAAGDPNIVATFEADLSGLAGGAATVFASGLLTNDPAFGLFAALPNGTVVELPAASVARVQIIHNAPDPTVDIYVNGGLVEADFAFREATDFRFVPADVALDIQVVPAGGDPATDDVYTEPAVTLENGSTYILTAQGVLGDMDTPFTIAVNDMGQEMSGDLNEVDLLALHGSPDAPNVDIDARAVGTLVEDLEYGEYAGYLTVAPDVYYIDVRAAGDPNIVATFEADLSALGGGAAVVFASGFLTDTPGFGLFAALPTGAVVELPVTSVARVQIIHNSPDPTVDIYVNGGLVEADFAFREATDFRFVPADVALDIQVVPAGGDPATDDVYTEPAVTLENGSTYVLTAQGVVGDMDTPFTIAVNDMGQETAGNMNEVDLLAIHGSPDAPNVDIDARTVGTLIEDLEYGTYAGYLSVAPELYFLDVRAAGDPNIVATFAADLSGLAGGAAVVFASGFLNDTPGFGLFAALPNGTVIQLPATSIARVQVIHNAPSPTVDVYVNGNLVTADFAFRDATPFQFVAADTPLDIQVVPAGGDPVTDDVYNEPAVTLENGGTYVLTAQGIVGSGMTPFTIAINDMGQEAAQDMNEVDLLVVHGSPNAPNVDVDARAVGTLVEDLAYGEYAGYLSVDPGVYYLDIRAAGDPNIVATFEADVSGLAGGAATVFASGILGGSPAFGLFAALPDGTVIELPATSIARIQLIHNSPEPTVDIYANGGLIEADFAFREATEFRFVPGDVALDIQVVPAGGDPVTDDVYTEPDITLENGKTYVVVANGIVGDLATPFTLDIQDMGLEAATDAGDVDFTILHGSPGAPAVDVEALGVVSGTLTTGLAYGSFTEYVSVPAAPYILTILAGGGALSLDYYADLEPLAGQAATIFASGLIGGMPGFGIFAALADGTVIQIPAISGYADVQVIHNSPGAGAEEVDVYLNGALALDDFAFRTATDFFQYAADIPLSIGIAPAGSGSVADTIANFRLENGLAIDETYVVTAGGVVGDPTTPFGLQIYAGAKQAADNGTDVEFIALHGSPDAPNVDVDARTVATLIEDLPYGTYTADYTAVPADLYYLDVRAAGDPNIVATFEADLSGLAGGAATVFASGFLTDTPGFGLFAALPDGTVVEFPAVRVARAQLIHNSPEPTVDIYLNDELAYEGLAFRQATEYGFVRAEEPVNIKVVPAGGDPTMDAVLDADVTFETNGDTYVVMATGVVGNVDTPFGLELFKQGREAAAAGGVDLLLYHGSPDAPEVDVVNDADGSVLFDNIEYGEFSADYLNVPADAYVLNITPADDNGNVVAAYEADVSGLDGGAAVVFASGYFSGDAPAFGVWVALPDGTTFPLPSVSATAELASKLNAFELVPNPATTQSMLSLDVQEGMEAQISIFDATGRLMDVVFDGFITQGATAFDLDLSKLQNGLYTVSIMTAQGVAATRLVISK